MWDFKIKKHTVHINLNALWKIITLFTVGGTAYCYVPYHLQGVVASFATAILTCIDALVKIEKIPNVES